MSRTAVADPPRRRRSSSTAGKSTPRRTPRSGAHDLRGTSSRSSAGSRGTSSRSSAGARNGASRRSSVRGAHDPYAPGVHTGSVALAAAVPERRPDTRRDTDRRGRHLRAVPNSRRRVSSKSSRRARRRRLAVICAALLVVAAALGLVYLHVLGAERQFTLNSLQTQVTKAQRLYNEQRLQVSQLEAPGRIVSVAQGQLGMVPPQNVVYLNAPPPSTPPAGTPNPAPAHAKQGNDAPLAPAGDANWPQIKKLLKGTP